MCIRDSLGLEDWFAGKPFDATGFLDALATSHYVQGKKGQRLFDRLTGCDGPMFGVFDKEELDLIDAWLDEAPFVKNLDIMEVNSKITLHDNWTPSFNPHANTIELSRHTGRDCRYPEHREVNVDCPPWPLGSGNPCRNDGVFLKSTVLAGGLNDGVQF